MLSGASRLLIVLDAIRLISRHNSCRLPQKSYQNFTQSSSQPERLSLEEVKEVRARTTAPTDFEVVHIIELKIGAAVISKRWERLV